MCPVIELSVVIFSPFLNDFIQKFITKLFEILYSK